MATSNQNREATVEEMWDVAQNECGLNDIFSFEVVWTQNQESTVDVVSQILRCGHDAFGHNNKGKQTRERILWKILTS